MSIFSAFFKSFLSVEERSAPVLVALMEVFQFCCPVAPKNESMVSITQAFVSFLKIYRSEFQDMRQLKMMRLFGLITGFKGKLTKHTHIETKKEVEAMSHIIDLHRELFPTVTCTLLEVSHSQNSRNDIECNIIPVNIHQQKPLSDLSGTVSQSPLLAMFRECTSIVASEAHGAPDEALTNFNPEDDDACFRNIDAVASDLASPELDTEVVVAASSKRGATSPLPQQKHTHNNLSPQAQMPNTLHNLRQNQLKDLSFSTFVFADLDLVSSSRSLRNQLPRYRWIPPNEEMMLTLVCQRLFPTSDVSSALPCLKFMIFPLSDDVKRIQHMFELYQKEMCIDEINEEAIVQPFFNAFVKQLCSFFREYLNSELVHDINDYHLEACFPNDTGGEIVIPGRGDLVYGSRFAKLMTRWLLMAELKASFKKLIPKHLDQLFLQLFANLNQKLIGKFKGVARDDVPPTQAPQTLNEYFNHRSSSKTASVMGLVSNFRSLVLAYGEFRNGGYEFGFTPLGETLTQNQFVLRLLYILSHSPEEVILQAKESRMKNAAESRANTTNFHLLDDDYCEVWNCNLFDAHRSHHSDIEEETATFVSNEHLDYLSYDACKM